MEDECQGCGIAEDVVVPVEERPPRSLLLLRTRRGRISRLPPILEVLNWILIFMLFDLLVLFSK